VIVNPSLPRGKTVRLQKMQARSSGPFDTHDSGAFEYGQMFRDRLSRETDSMPHGKTVADFEETLTVAVGELTDDDPSRGVGKGPEQRVHDLSLCNPMVACQGMSARRARKRHDPMPCHSFAPTARVARCRQSFAEPGANHGIRSQLTLRAQFAASTLNDREAVVKKHVLAIVLVLVASALTAQEEVTVPWAAPVPEVEEGARLIAIGFWGDVVGIGLIAGAGPAYSLSFGVGQTLFELGLISMLLVGNPVLQRGLHEHHDALDARGYDIPTANMERSDLFSKIALGCGGGAVAVGIGAAIAQSTGLAVGSILLGATGAVCEIINFYKFRVAWADDMKVAAGVAEAN